MGLLDPADWHAEWIGLDAEPPADGSTLTESQRARITQYPWMITTVATSQTDPVTACVRRVFTVPPGKKLLRATLVVTCDQICTITANGRPSGEIACWDRAHPIDITAAVVPGENVVGLRVTQYDGYPPAALGEIELALADSEPVRILIDASWRFAVDPPAGWDQPGFSDQAWHPLEVIPDHESPWGSPQDATHFLVLPGIVWVNWGHFCSKKLERNALSRIWHF